MELTGVRKLEGQPALLIEGDVYVYIGGGEWNKIDDPSGDFGYASPIEGEELKKLMEMEDLSREERESRQ